jgi:hypothetical protein
MFALDPEVCACFVLACLHLSGTASVTVIDVHSQEHSEVFEVMGLTFSQGMIK